MYKVSQAIFREKRKQFHQAVVIAVLLATHLEYKGGIRKHTDFLQSHLLVPESAQEEHRHLPVKAPANDEFTGRI